MLSRILFLLIFTAVALAGQSSIAAQNPQNEWSRVQQVAKGSSVIIQTKDRRALQGKVVAVSPDSIALIYDGNQFSLPADSVQTVHRARSGSRLKRAFYGGLIGGAVGVAALGAYTVAAKADPLTAAGGVLFGVPAGAAIGAATSGKKSRGELIYIAT